MEHKQTLDELSKRYHLAIETIRRNFCKKVRVKWRPPTCVGSVNLVADATYFSRSDGVLVFRGNQQNIDISFIKSETRKVFIRRFKQLDKLGIIFKSITLDGKKGIIKLCSELYPNTPIQFCQFHQKQIIRRYLTCKPKTHCGRQIQNLMKKLKDHEEESFTEALYHLKLEHDDFLQERNASGQFKHRSVRSALRSLTTNMPYLFAYKKYPELNIPNTTNSCDGSFGQWKYRVELHRGLKRYRRNKLIIYLLNRR